MLGNIIRYSHVQQWRSEDTHVLHFKGIILKNQTKEFVDRVKGIDIITESHFRLEDDRTHYNEIRFNVRVHKDFSIVFVDRLIQEIVDRLNNLFLYYYNGEKRPKIKPSTPNEDYLDALKYQMKPYSKMISGVREKVKESDDKMKYLIDLEKIVFNEKLGRTTLVFKNGFGRIFASKAQLTKGDKYNEKIGFLIALTKRYYAQDTIDNAYNRYGKYQTQLIVHLETLLAKTLVSFTNLSLYQIHKLFDSLDKNQIVFGDGDYKKTVLIERK